MLTLPTKSIEVVKIEFTADERKGYDFLFEGVEKTLDDIETTQGGMKKNYTKVVSLLVMLRRDCNHPILVRNLALLHSAQQPFSDSFPSSSSPAHEVVTEW